MAKVYIKDPFEQILSAAMDLRQLDLSTLPYKARSAIRNMDHVLTRFIFDPQPGEPKLQIDHPDDPNQAVTRTLK